MEIRLARKLLAFEGKEGFMSYCLWRSLRTGLVYPRAHEMHLRFSLTKSGLKAMHLKLCERDYDIFFALLLWHRYREALED